MSGLIWAPDTINTASRPEGVTDETVTLSFPKRKPGQRELRVVVRVPDDPAKLREEYVRLVAEAEVARRVGPGMLIRETGISARLAGRPAWEWLPRQYSGPGSLCGARAIEIGEKVRLQDESVATVLNREEGCGVLCYIVRVEGEGPTRRVGPADLVPLVNP